MYTYAISIFGTVSGALADGHVTDVHHQHGDYNI